MRPVPLSPSHQEIRIGSKLRAARKAHGYTLDQLATSAGLTKGFLSRVERDEASLSVTSLVTLCQVMSLDVGALLSVPEVTLVRRDMAPSINLGGTGVAEHLMTPRGESRLQLVHSHVEPGGSGGADLYTINCDVELVYCLSGSINLIFTDREQQLVAGDALTFDGGEPHTWVNASTSRSAEVVWVLLPAPWSGSS